MKEMQRTVDRLMDKVTPEPNSGCWLWTGHVMPGGYGQIHYQGKTQYAHRVAYIVLEGEIPDGLDLDHKCRVRCCVNPSHLEPVTRKENLRRGAGPETLTAKSKALTHCRRGHEYNAENTRVYNGTRHCLPCKRLAKKRYRMRRKQNVG